MGQSGIVGRPGQPGLPRTSSREQLGYEYSRANLRQNQPLFVDLSDHLDRIYEKARPLYERALAACEELLGSENPQTAACLLNLASLLGDQTHLATFATRTNWRERDSICTLLKKRIGLASLRQTGTLGPSTFALRASADKSGSAFTLALLAPKNGIDLTA